MAEINLLTMSFFTFVLQKPDCPRSFITLQNVTIKSVSLV